MVDNLSYQKQLKEYGLEDVNEILNKNDYQSPEESDPDNDPNAPMEQKRINVYKLSWRSDKVS